MILFFTFDTPQEKDKFEHIYSTYKNLLYYKAYGILNDYSLAEDATSEAFIRIYKNFHKIKNPDSNIGVAYLVTIVKNVSLTMLKKEKSQRTDPIEELAEYGEEPTDNFSLEEEVLDGLSSEKIYEIIDSVKEEYRVVFLLKYGQGLSHKQIAESLQISEKNATVRLSRAKAAIQKAMIKEGYSHEAGR